MSHSRRTSCRARRGFNLIETLIALAMMGILLAMGAPRLNTIKERGAVRSARDQLQGYLLTARSSAMRRGQPATFHVASHSMWVTGASGSDTLARRRALQDEFEVSVTSSLDSVRFNSRGFATNLVGNGKITVSRSGFTDSLCVSRLGTITTQCGF